MLTATTNDERIHPIKIASQMPRIIAREIGHIICVLACFLNIERSKSMVMTVMRDAMVAASLFRSVHMDVAIGWKSNKTKEEEPIHAEIKDGEVIKEENWG